MRKGKRKKVEMELHRHVITLARRTKYSDDGHVFEAPAPAFLQRSVRVYLTGPRSQLWQLHNRVEMWKSLIDKGELTVPQLLKDIVKLDKAGRYGFTYERQDSLLPYRTTVRVSTK